MAVFFKTPAPPGVAAGLRHGVIVRAENLSSEAVARPSRHAVAW